MSGLVSQTKNQSIRNYFCNASVLIILFSASGCDPGIEPFLTYFVCAIKIHSQICMLQSFRYWQHVALDLLPRRNPSIYIYTIAFPILICNNL